MKIVRPMWGNAQIRGRWAGILKPVVHGAFATVQNIRVNTGQAPSAYTLVFLD